MARKMRALVGGLVAAAAIAGCTGEHDVSQPRIGPGALVALRGAELRTVGAPGAPDLPFGEALITYSRQIGAIHAFTGARADPQIHAAVRQLATVLDRMPAAAAQPALRRAAARIRADQTDVDPDEPAVAPAQRSLAIAATALLDLASSAYAASPEIGALARNFAGAVEAIDVERTPPDRASVIDALVRGERVLAAMYATNVRRPSPPAVPPARR